MGNHEALCLDPYPDDWLANGGRQTQASYGGPSPVPSGMDADLPLTHRHGRWFFAHAGIDPLLPLARQERETLLWIRRPFLDFEGVMPEGVVVVHGHTPKPDPEIKANRIGIDTGACYGGMLTSAVLSDKLERIIQASRTV